MARKNKIDKNENILIIGAVLLVLLLLFSFGWGFGHIGGMIFFGPIFMILALALIIWLIISLTRQR